MIRSFSITCLALALSGQVAYAQSQICKELTGGGIFNASDLQSDSERFSYLQDEFCDTYNSQSARSESSGLGAGGNYGLFGASFNKSEAVASNEALFKQVCTSSVGQFQMNEQLRSSVRQASKDLAEMFVECVKTTSTGFHSYFTSPTYDAFTINLYNNANVEPHLYIQRVAISPDAAEVKCMPEAAMTATEENPYTTPKQKYFSLSCTKKADQAAFVHLLVAQAGGPVEGLLPSIEDKLGEMDDRINQMNAALNQTSEQLQRVSRVQTGILQCPYAEFPIGGSWMERASWHVVFEPPFRDTPSVSASVAKIEGYSSNAGEAWAVDVSNISPSGARISFRGAMYSNSLSQCGVQWTAVGR